MTFKTDCSQYIIKEKNQKNHNHVKITEYTQSYLHY